MKRLKNPKKILFYPSFVIADVGVYDDAKAPGGAKAILNFKKEGVSLMNTAILDATPTGAAFGSGIKVTAAYSDDGIYQSALLKLNAPAKNEDIYYDYGFTIRKKVKYPGVYNAQTNLYEKSYGGTMDVVTTSSGYVVDANKLTMENELLDHVTNDVTMHTNNADLVTNFAGSIVEARRVYLVSAVATTETLSVNDPDGNAIGTQALNATGATILTACNDINDDATINPYVLAVAASSTSMYVIFKTAGYKGTLSGADLTFTRYIMLTAKDTEVQFDAIFEGDFFTKYNIGFMRLTYANDVNSIWKVNNATAVTVNANPASATGLAAQITAGAIGGSAGLYVYAGPTTTGATTCDVVLLPTVDTISIKKDSIANVTGTRTPAYTTVLTTNYLASSPTGKFPSLTSDEVNRAVWNLQDTGRLPGVYHSQATDGTAYAKYHFLVSLTANDDMGVSQSGTYVDELIVYADKTAAGTTTTFEIGTYEGTAATCTFEALVASWHGVSQIYWLPDISVVT